MGKLLNWKRKIKFSLFLVMALLVIKVGVRMFPFGEIAFMTLPHLSTSLLATLAFLGIEISIFCAVLIDTDLIRQNKTNILLRIGRKKTNWLYGIDLIEAVILYESILLGFAGISYCKAGIIDAGILFLILVGTIRKKLSIQVEVVLFALFIGCVLMNHTLIID